VRKALSMLIDRKLMNEKYMFNQYFLLNTYFPSLWPGHANPNAPFYKYEPDSARALLAQAGYKANATGQLVDAKGTPLTLTFLTYETSDTRHITKFQEDLRKVGIESTIEPVSLSTFRQRIDEFDFDLCWMAWGAGRLSDPEASWSSATAMQQGTNTVTGVQDSLIDSLIQAQKTEMSLTKRNEILKQIDNRLTEIVPYILLWQNDNNRLLYWNRFGTPPFVYDKFGREEAIPVYWWFDAQKSAKLGKAMVSGEQLSAEPGDVRWKENY
jgi:microcin C transport system substrate-binding protein